MLKAAILAVLLLAPIAYTPTSWQLELEQYGDGLPMPGWWHDHRRRGTDRSGKHLISSCRQEPNLVVYLNDCVYAL